jgi:HK97 gp10 family phage protein
VIVSVNVSGINAALATKRKSIERALARGVTKGAMLIQKTAREKILKGPKTGRLYGTVSDMIKADRGGKAAARRLHQASGPGEAPANDTGNLQRSINIVAASPSDRATANVTANAEYAAPLEYGTKTMEPRPFMEPSMIENKDKCAEVLRIELVQAVMS